MNGEQTRIVDGRRYRNEVWKRGVEKRGVTEVWERGVGQRCGNEVWERGVEKRGVTEVWDRGVGKRPQECRQCKGDDCRPPPLVHPFSAAEDTVWAHGGRGPRCHSPLSCPLSLLLRRLCGAAGLDDVAVRPRLCTLFLPLRRLVRGCGTQCRLPYLCALAQLHRGAAATSERRACCPRVAVTTPCAKL